MPERAGDESREGAAEPERAANEAAETEPERAADEAAAEVAGRETNETAEGDVEEDAGEGSMPGEANAGRGPSSPDESIPDAVRATSVGTVTRERFIFPTF